jgi:hypothetical protein
MPDDAWDARVDIRAPPPESLPPGRSKSGVLR